MATELLVIAVQLGVAIYNASREYADTRVVMKEVSMKMNIVNNILLRHSQTSTLATSAAAAAAAAPLDIITNIHQKLQELESAVTDATKLSQVMYIIKRNTIREDTQGIMQDLTWYVSMLGVDQTMTNGSHLHALQQQQHQQPQTVTINTVTNNTVTNNTLTVQMQHIDARLKKQLSDEQKKSDDLRQRVQRQEIELIDLRAYGIRQSALLDEVLKEQRRLSKQREAERKNRDQVAMTKLKNEQQILEQVASFIDSIPNDVAPSSAPSSVPSQQPSATTQSSSDTSGITSSVTSSVSASILEAIQDPVTFEPMKDPILVDGEDCKCCLDRSTFKKYIKLKKEMGKAPRTCPVCMGPLRSYKCFPNVYLMDVISKIHTPDDVDVINGSTVLQTAHNSPSHYPSTTSPSLSKVESTINDSVDPTEFTKSSDHHHDSGIAAVEVVVNAVDIEKQSNSKPEDQNPDQLQSTTNSNSKWWLRRRWLLVSILVFVVLLVAVVTVLVLLSSPSSSTGSSTASSSSASTGNDNSDTIVPSPLPTSPPSPTSPPTQDPTPLPTQSPTMSPTPNSDLQVLNDFFARVNITVDPATRTRIDPHHSLSFGTSMPTQIGLLTSLTELNFWSNDLRGTIPSHLGLLTSLTDLSLDSNQLTGTIPSHLGLLTSLESLGLHLNQLTGTIPSHLCLLTSLPKLDLSRNQLTGAIPSHLCLLTSLPKPDLGLRRPPQPLDLSRNQLTGTIPSQLDLLSLLEIVDLYENQLTGTIPSQLGQLTSLPTLILNQNQLAGTIPSQLGLLTTLTVLGLSQNQLIGTIPSQLGLLTSLIALDLSQNQLIGTIPSELGLLTSLTWLALSQNQLTGTIPSGLVESSFELFNVTTGNPGLQV